MRAMILAAGRGRRMQPLSDERPKALLHVNHMPLIDYHLKHLHQAGIEDVVINLAHYGDMIKKHCGENLGKF